MYVKDIDLLLSNGTAVMSAMPRVFDLLGEKLRKES